ncbi:prephenate dehydratase domain-containing protein [Nocardia sp. NPDC059195]|uniref:prephenate dehydratase domain-containing protein n=1 Tax=Nocardia sp. NPDC059195 TaxID=3346765 RepID=UPI0036BE1752
MPQSSDEHFLEISWPSELTGGTVATLGPLGTSSQLAAERLIRWLITAGTPGTAPELFLSYEDAAAAVIGGDADLMVVANAYAGISEFYMNTRLHLAGAFHNQTPLYGIAVEPGVELPAALRIASHPAPVPLIGQLLPDHLVVQEVVLTKSTSQAALAVRSGEVDAALTTQPSAERYGLSFISRVRPIEMLWSVFCAADERMVA